MPFGYDGRTLNGIPTYLHFIFDLPAKHFRQHSSGSALLVKYHIGKYRLIHILPCEELLYQIELACFSGSLKRLHEV